MSLKILVEYLNVKIIQFWYGATAAWPAFQMGVVTKATLLKDVFLNIIWAII